MKTTFKHSSIVAAISLILTGSLALPSVSFGKQGATDPIQGTSKGTVSTGGGGSGGGGGGKTGTTTPVTLPPIPSTPVQPVLTGTLTMTGGVYNGTTPACTGTYRIDPYYPTLSLITVTLSATGISASDGLPLYITVNGTGTLYPFLGGSMTVVGGNASGNSQIYCTPGTTITGVTVMDLAGNIVFSGK